MSRLEVIVRAARLSIGVLEAEGCGSPLIAMSGSNPNVQWEPSQALFGRSYAGVVDNERAGGGG